MIFFASVLNQGIKKMGVFMFQRLLGIAVISLVLLTGCDNKKEGGDQGDKLAGNLRSLTANERAADFDQLLQIFKTYYGPYQLKERQFKFSIEKLAQDLKAQAVNAKTEEEFMGYVLQFGAALRDGHVSFRVENSSSGISRYSIPILLTPIEGKAIVADIEEKLAEFTGISKGDEVLTVDGKTPEEYKNMSLKYDRNGNDFGDEASIFYAFSRRTPMTDLLPKSTEAEVKYKKADGSTQIVRVAWSAGKYIGALDRMLKLDTGLNFIYPRADEFKLIDSHLNQMGQDDPIFLTPETQKKYGFVKVYPSDATRKKFKMKDEEKPPIYGALYKYEGKTILLARIAHFSPQDYRSNVYMKAYAAMFSEYEELVDVLVLDQTHNPGGSYCAEFYNIFAREGDVQSVEQLRADRKWINDLYVTWQDPKFVTEFPWDSKALLAWGLEVEKAYDKGEFLSAPIPLFGNTTYAIPYGYTWKKPMLVLIDEMAGSCGDLFPMLVKSNKRAQLFGRNTMGLGGNVERIAQLTNSRINVSLTRGLFHSYRPDGAYVPSDIVENNGVAPDIEYSHTVEDFRNGYVNYVKTFSEEALKQIK